VHTVNIIKGSVSNQIRPSYDGVQGEHITRLCRAWSACLSHPIIPNCCTLLGLHLHSPLSARPQHAQIGPALAPGTLARNPGAVSDPTLGPSTADDCRRCLGVSLLFFTQFAKQLTNSKIQYQPDDKQPEHDLDEPEEPASGARAGRFWRILTARTGIRVGPLQRENVRAVRHEGGFRICRCGSIACERQV